MNCELNIIVQTLRGADSARRVSAFLNNSTSFGYTEETAVQHWELPLPMQYSQYINQIAKV